MQIIVTVAVADPNKTDSTVIEVENINRIEDDVMSAKSIELNPPRNVIMKAFRLGRKSNRRLRVKKPTGSPM